MSELRPKETVQKLLISTTSRFVGEYEKEDFLITQAWPNFTDLHVWTTLTENPVHRNSFILAFTTPPIDREKTATLPDYLPMGDIICTYLSVLFGKRFDNHGLIEGSGFYHIPQIQEYTFVCNPSLPQNNHQPRKDLEIDLNLSEVSRIERLFLDDSLDDRFLKFLRVAGRFYLQALQTFERQPETAYLSLITCGEILSNYFEYDFNDIIDSETKNLLDIIEKGLNDGPNIAKQIRGRFFQIKRKFTETVKNLLNDYFYSNTESRLKIASLKKDDIDVRISAAYDLRSRYVHTGIDFGKWISLGSINNEEVQIGKPVVEDKEFQKILTKAPTYHGLERIIRFCLLRFMQLHGITIDQRLEEE